MYVDGKWFEEKFKFDASIDRLDRQLHSAAGIKHLDRKQLGITPLIIRRTGFCMLESTENGLVENNSVFRH